MKNIKYLFLSALAFQSISAHSLEGTVEVNGVEIIENSDWSCSIGSKQKLRKMDIDVKSALREDTNNSRSEHEPHDASFGYLIEHVNRVEVHNDGDVQDEDAYISKYVNNMVSAVELQIIYDNVRNHILSLNVDSVTENRLLINVEQMKENYHSLTGVFGSLGTKAEHTVTVYSKGIFSNERSYYKGYADVHEVCFPTELMDPNRIEELLINWVDQTIDNAECDLQCDAEWFDWEGLFCAEEVTTVPLENSFPDANAPTTGLFTQDNILYQYKPENAKVCYL